MSFPTLTGTWNNTTWDWNQPQSFDLIDAGRNDLINLWMNEQNPCRRGAGIPLGFSLASISVAKAVASIAEPLIKGLGHIFGAAFSLDCSLSTGLQMVFIVTPLMGLCSLVMTPIAIAIDLLVVPFWVAIAPDHFKQKAIGNVYF
jgi:hypothetical protein